MTLLPSATTHPADLSDTRASDHVCILLGLYQGAAFLQEQLDSFATQAHQNWSLVASDDGSTDDSRAVLSQFAARYPTRHIMCRDGPQLGFARNFLSLLQAVPDTADFAAFSDQDDVWFPDKLTRAVDILSRFPVDQPALYCADTLICAKDLTPLGRTRVFHRDPDFRNALVQSIAGGNTMALNRAALDLARSAAIETSSLTSHDWWLYQLISGCGGKIVRDPRPVLHYRQHGKNIVGSNLSLRARIDRVFQLLGGRFQDFNDCGIAALKRVEHRLTPEARRTLAAFAQARRGPLPSRLRALRKSGVFRQKRLDNIALYFACVLNRL